MVSMNQKKESVLRVGQAILLALLLCLALAFPAFAEESDTMQSFQTANDAIQALTEDSTQEDWERAYQLLGQIPDESATQEAALTGSMTDNQAGNIQLLFAQLQQQMAQDCKQQAQQKMQEIIKQQETQRLITEYINTARVSQNQVDSKNAPQPISANMRTFLLENNLFPASVNSSAAAYTKAEWMLIEVSLESYQSAMAQATQQQMVYVQDYMGQYNQYMQGISGSQMASRSQTMLGGTSAGMTVTCLLAGAVAGAVVTLLVTRKRKNV